jgi:SAM-dependent methyltransferase
VLDLACGPGTLTRRLATGAGPDGLVVGADLSPAMLTRAARSVHAENTVFVRADAMDLPLRDASVDAVCCSLCLQLVPDLDTALAQIARVLRPGGRLATAVPAHGRGPFRLGSELLARGGQARLFHRGELADALVRHGFVRVVTRRDSVMQIVDAVAPGAAPPRG